MKLRSRSGRRLLCIALTLVLLWPACAIAEGTGEWIMEMQSVLYDVENDVVWTAPSDEQGDRLALFCGPAGGEQRAVCMFSETITAFSVQGDLACVATGYKRSGEDKKLYCVRADGTVESEWEMPRWMNGNYDAVTSVLLLEDYIALMTGDVWGDALHLLDRRTGEIRSVSQIYAAATGAFARSGINELVVFHVDMSGPTAQNPSPALYRVYADTASAERLGSPGASAADSFMPSAAMVDPQGAIYMADDISGSVRAFLADGSPNGTWLLNRGQIAGRPVGVFGAARFDGEWLYMKIDDDLYRAPALLQGDREEDGRAAITVHSVLGPLGFEQMLSQDRMPAAVAAFEKDRPDLRVEFSSSSYDDLTLALTAGLSNADIFFVEQSEYRQAMHRAGLFDDLSAYPQIVSSLADWIEIGAMSDADGHIFILPVSVRDIDVLMPYSARRPQEFGLEIPDGAMAAQQLISLAARARERGGLFSPLWLIYRNETNLRKPIANYLAYHADVLHGRADFATPEFEAILGLWKQLHDEGLTTGKSGRTALFTADKIFSAEEIYAAVAGGDCIYQPNAAGEPLASLALDGLHLYAHSPQKEDAAQFLAVFASADVQRRLERPGSMFLKDVSLYDEYEIWAAEDERLSGDGYARWKAMLERSRIQPDITALSGLLTEYLPEYFEGRMREQELISALDRRFGAVLGK